MKLERHPIEPVTQFAGRSECFIKDALPAVREFAESIAAHWQANLGKVI
jgi:hypothetical protein